MIIMAIDTDVLKEKISDVYYSVRRYILWELRYAHRDFATGVKNLWKWFPIIWKDRDWDQHFIYETLRRKLEFQAKYIVEKDRYTRAQRDAEVMLLCSRLIEIQQEEMYVMEYLDYEISDMRFVDIEDKPDCKEVKMDLISENFDDYFAKYPRQYKRVVAGDVNRYKRPIKEKSKQLIAMEIAHDNQDRSRKLLFKLLEQNIERWWD